MDVGSIKRAFIVGCGRSGTTLLESLLGGHTLIKGFPESAFFLCIIGQIDSRSRVQSEVALRRKLGRTISDVRVRLGIPNKSLAREAIRQFAEKIERPEILDEFPENSISISVQVEAFTRILDRLTVEDGKSFWIEKTPLHLYYVDEIEKYLKPVKIIYLVRSGPDVVASLFDASKNYDEKTWGEFHSLDKCINQWNHSIAPILSHMHKRNHMAVSYEQLVEDSPRVLRRLCEFLEIEYDPDMLTNYSKVAAFVSSGEPWKVGASSAIRNANSTKFKTALTEEQQVYVMDRLIKVDHSQFYVS